MIAPPVLTATPFAPPQEEAAAETTDIDPADVEVQPQEPLARAPSEPASDEAPSELELEVEEAPEWHDAPTVEMQEERAPSPVPFVAPVAPRARPLEQTQPTVLAPAPARRRTLARLVAMVSVTLASLVLAAVLGLIAYRESSYRHPQLDRALVLLGAARHAPIEPTDGVGDLVEPEGDPGDDVAVVVDAGTVEGETVDGETVEAETVEAETVEAETVEAETIEAETIEAETIEAETIEAETVESETAAEDEDISAESNVANLVARAQSAGNSPLAERLYRRVLEIEPREHLAMTGLGRLLLDRGAHAEAAPLLRGAVSRRPRRAAYRIWLGDALAGAGNAAAARTEWERALELEPDNAQARSRLGR